MSRANGTMPGPSASTTMESLGSPFEAVVSRQEESHSSPLTLRTVLRDHHRLRRHWGRILDVIPIGIILMNEVGKIQRLNAAAKSLLGIEGNAPGPLTIQALWKQLRLPPVPVSGWEHRGRCLSIWDHRLEDAKEGTSRSVRLIQEGTSGVPVPTANARPERLAELGEMLGKVVHELRTPIGSIELFASLLRDRVDEGEERRVLADQLLWSVRTLGHLAANVLMFAKTYRPRKQAFHVGGLVDQVEALASASLQQRMVTIKRVIEPEAEWIYADEPLVRHAVLNLLLNAIAASSPGDAIEVSCRREPSPPGKGVPDQPGFRSVLRIQDGGRGMSAHDLAKAFDPFFSGKLGGCGLGLSIVKQVMAVHEGEVRMTSQEGMGTTVSLCFPQQGRPA